MISPHLSLEQVLERVAGCLGKKREGDRDDEEGDEESEVGSEDDEADDCYYGDDDIDADMVDDVPSSSK